MRPPLIAAVLVAGLAWAGPAGAAGWAGSLVPADVSGRGPSGSTIATDPAGRIAYFGVPAAGGRPARIAVGRLDAARRMRAAPGGVTLPFDVAQLALSTDRAFLYAAGPGGVAVFSRDPATGALTAVTGPPSAAAARVAPLPDGRVLALGGGALTTLARDRASGALVAVATTPVAQAGDLVASPEGRHAYVVGVGIGTLAAFTVGDDGSLAPVAGTPLPGEPCPRPAGCPPSRLLLSPDGATLYVDDRILVRDPASGGLTVRCARDCVPDQSARGGDGGTAIAPDGRQLYVTTSQTVSEAPRSAPFLKTLSRAPSGLLTDRPDDEFGSVLLSETEGPAPAVAFLAGGRILVTAEGWTLRRTTRPPRVSIRGLPSKGCARRAMRVRVAVTGPVDPRRRLRWHAHEFLEYDEGPTFARGATTARRFSFVIPRQDGLYVDVDVTVPGRGGNDRFVERQVEFCR